MRAQRKFKKVNLMPNMSRDRSGLLGKKKAEVHMGSCAKYSLLRDWMSQIRAKVILFPKIELRTIRLPYLGSCTGKTVEWRPRIVYIFVLLILYYGLLYFIWCYFLINGRAPPPGVSASIFFFFLLSRVLVHMTRRLLLLFPFLLCKEDVVISAHLSVYLSTEV